MGLRSDIQNALSEAFDDPDGLADVVVDFQLERTTKSGAYDPATDTRTTTVETWPGRGVFAAYKTMEIDNSNIKTGDEKLIINGADLTEPPQINDKITRGTSKRYHVVNPVAVMGGGSEAVVYVVQVRENAE